MINYSLRDSSAFNAGEHNGTGSHKDIDYDDYRNRGWDYVSIFTVLICILGIFGNGMVVWLLGFHIKRNPFTTYVLNLAIADFGVIVVAIIEKINFEVLLQMFLQINLNLFIVFDTIYSFMFCASQFLLMVISMDRCVSVFFPLWHRCHRPTQLSTIICALIWAFSILPPVICFIIYKELFSSYVMLFQLAANGFLCFPLMTVSSLMLFIKVCCKSKQQRRGKLLITILVTVFFFCFLCFPFNVVYAIYFFFHWKFTLYNYVKFCACLNSSVNPLIYYLVGRPEKGHSNKSMKAALQTLFKEEEIKIHILGKKQLEIPALTPK